MFPKDSKIINRTLAAILAVSAAGFITINLGASANAQSINSSTASPPSSAASTTPTTGAGTFSRNLTVGDRGNDVLALQQFLTPTASGSHQAVPVRPATKRITSAR